MNHCSISVEEQEQQQKGFSNNVAGTTHAPSFPRQINNSGCSAAATATHHHQPPCVGLHSHCPFSVPLPPLFRAPCCSRPPCCCYFFHNYCYAYPPVLCRRFFPPNCNRDPLASASASASATKAPHPLPFLHRFPPKPIFGCPNFHCSPPCRPLPFPPTATALSKHGQEEHHSISPITPEKKQNMGVVLSQSIKPTLQPPNGLQEEEVDNDAEYEEEEEEDEPVYVLTDEWMEFFAKSEAKRRQGKKSNQKKNRK